MFTALHTIDVIKEELEAEKKRKLTPVVGDMQPLADSLPTAEEMRYAAHQDKLQRIGKVNDKKIRHLEEKM